MKKTYYGKIVVGGMVSLVLIAILIWCLLPVKTARANTITKSVTKALPINTNEVAFKLVIVDNDHPLEAGDVTVIDKIYRESYSTGTIGQVRTEIAKRMQADIDNYKDVKNLVNNAAYETARSIIESALDVSE